MKRLTHFIFLLLLSTLSLDAKSLRVETEELFNNTKNYIILDARSKKLYEKGHIKGALNFPVNLTYKNIKKNGQLTNPFAMQEIIRSLGIDTHSNIVIYDDGTFFDAARLFWTLEVYGFKNPKLLNTGYQNWFSLGYDTTQDIPITNKSNYIALVNNKRLATKFTTQIASRNPNQIIIDARDNKSYQGITSSAKRYGHIPKAFNIPGSHNIEISDNTTHLKTIEKLKDLYKGIDKNKKVVLYCAIGRVAASNYFALRELEYDVANYDASWKEWGNDDALPIVTPIKK